MPQNGTKSPLRHLDEQELAQTARHWDERAKKQPTASWWQLGRCMLHVNEMLTGSSEHNWIHLLKQHFMKDPVELAVSFGSGDATYEEELLKSGLVRTMHCWELSAERCRIAESRLVPRYGRRVRIVNDDFVKSRYPEGSVDLAYVHGALHHMRALESVLDHIHRLLSKDGLFVIDDFFGPTGMQWTDDQLLWCNAMLDALPDELKRMVRDPSILKSKVDRPSLEALWERDPSECARSSEIRRLLDDRFFIRLERRIGGAVFHPVLNGIAGNFEASAVGQLALDFILCMDRIATEAEVLNSDYRFIVCTPRKRRRPRRGQRKHRSGGQCMNGHDE